MARFEIAGIESGALGATMGADVFFELGMMYSTGRSVPADLVTAHKWFNLAALRQQGSSRCREIAAEMSGRASPRPARCPRLAQERRPRAGTEAGIEAGGPATLTRIPLEYTSWGRPETWPRG